MKHRRVIAKDLQINTMPELSNGCVVERFQLYQSLIPKERAFYRQALVWLTSSVFIASGWNPLSGKIVPKFCKQAGFSEHFTNHSRKVTCASQLFAENIDEQLIKLQTGHCSDAACS